MDEANTTGATVGASRHPTPEPMTAAGPRSVGPSGSTDDAAEPEDRPPAPCPLPPSPSAPVEEPNVDRDPVVIAVDERIRREALRQLKQLDLDDLDARVEPLWVLASGLTDGNSDHEDEPDCGILDQAPVRDPRTPPGLTDDN